MVRSSQSVTEEYETSHRCSPAAAPGPLPSEPNAKRCRRPTVSRGSAYIFRALLESVQAPTSTRQECFQARSMCLLDALVALTPADAPRRSPLDPRLYAK